jgi:WD40 repeat protein
MIYLNFHKAILTLFNTQEIIIKDVLEKKNYIIDIKERQINLILEIKSFNYLAITHFDSDIDIFDLNLMIMKNKLRGHRKIVNDIKELIPLPDSNYNTKLLSCSDDKTIRIWDLIKFYCEYIISFEKYSFLFSLNILPDKEIIALDNENIIHIID